MQTRYVALRTVPNGWHQVGQDVEQFARSADMPAEVTAGFAVQIGGSINTVPVLMRAETAEALDRGVAALSAVAGVRECEAVALAPVSERNLAALRPDGGVYTNRWFHVRADGAAEFEADTLAAWDSFEARTGTDVVGLWKTTLDADDVVRYLLIARYDSLDAWDKSRFFNRAEDERDADWMARFDRRRAMMVDSSVMTTRCLFSLS